MSNYIDEDEEEPKFSECLTCKNFNRKRICNQCDSGEFFEEEDPEGIDDFFNGDKYDR